MSYYNIDDILLLQHSFTCTFNTISNDIGFLDENSTEDNLNKDSVIDLPLWMASYLASIKLDDNSDLQVLNLLLPTFYNKNFMNNHLASPICTDLSSGLDNNGKEYYYDLGIKLLDITSNNILNLNNNLLKSFISRYHDIIDRSQLKSFDTTITSVYSKLTLLEKKIFDNKKAALNSFNRWKQGKEKKIKTSIFPGMTGRKRKTI